MRSLRTKTALLFLLIQTVPTTTLPFTTEGPYLISGSIGALIAGGITITFGLLYKTTRASKFSRAQKLVAWSKNDTAQLEAVLNFLPDYPIDDAQEAKEFYRTIESCYAKNSFPLINAYNSYMALNERMDKATALLDGAKKAWTDMFFAVDEQKFQATCDELKEKINIARTLVSKALIALKKNRSYYEQSQAQSAQASVIAQKQIAHQLFWNNVFDTRVHHHYIH